MPEVDDTKQCPLSEHYDGNTHDIWEFAPERYPNVSLFILNYPTLSVIARSFGISF